MKSSSPRQFYVLTSESLRQPTIMSSNAASPVQGAFSAGIAQMQRAVAASQAIMHFTTTHNDIRQADSRGFNAALRAYPVGNRKLEPFVQIEFDLINELGKKLKRLDQKLGEEGQQLPANMAGVVQRRSRSANEELPGFDGGACTLVRCLWGIGNGAILTWDLAVTLRGPERSSLPSRLSSIWRSVCIFIQYLVSPTANSRQMFDMSVQRTGMNLPNLLAYTLSFYFDIYGTTGYTAGTAAAGLALVALAVIPGRYRAVRENVLLSQYAAATTAPDADQLERGQSSARTFASDREDIEAILALIKKAAGDHELGHGIQNQHARLRSTTLELVRALNAVELRQAISPARNADRDKKRAVVGMGVVLVAFTLASTARNPLLFVTNLQWSVWFLYRLGMSTEDPGHQLDDTLALLSNSGAVVFISIPLVSIPLLTMGPKAFENHGLLITSTILQFVINGTFAHHFGPAGVALFGKLAPLLNWTGHAESKGSGTADGELAIDIEAFCARVQQIVESPISDTITQPDGYADMLSQLDHWEPVARRRLADTKSELRRSDTVTKQDMQAPSTLVDLFSAIDLSEDGKFLASRSDSAGSAGLFSFEEMVGHIFREEDLWAKSLLQATLD